MILEKKIGLIAGKGRFPLLVSTELKKLGREIVAVGFIDITDKKIKNYVDRIKWLKLGLLKPIIEYFKENDIKKIIVAGLIKHTYIFDDILDDLAKKIFARIKDNRADSILNGIAEEFLKENIELFPAIDILKNHVADKGIMTKNFPNEKQLIDIEFGYDIAKHIAQFDIGQTVVIKNKSIIAVEAMEGTDKCILRAGKLVGPNTVIVKVSKPQQDWRFDVPVVGLHTIEVMKKVYSKVIALESQKTIIVDKKMVIEKANKYGIIIVGI